MTGRDEPAATASDSRTAEELEREIAATRAEMDETMSEIQRRLSPGYMVDQAMTYFRSGPGEFIDNLGTTIKQNPVPFTLVGLGLAWLMVSGSRSQPRESAPRIGADAPDPPYGEVIYSDPILAAADQPQDSVEAEAKTGLLGRIGDAASSVGGKLAAVVSRHGNGSGSAGYGHPDRSAGYRPTAYDDASRGFAPAGVAYAHPLILAGLGVVVGAVLGALLPPPERPVRRPEYWPQSTRETPGRHIRAYERRQSALATGPAEPRALEPAASRSTELLEKAGGPP